MSVSEPVPLPIKIHGETPGGNATALPRLRVLGAGLRRIVNPSLAVPDGGSPLSATIIFRTMNPYFPGTAPVSATVTFRFNIADVVSLKIARIQTADLWFRKTMVHSIFPRTDESEDPYAFMWLGLATHAFLNTVSSMAHEVQEWLYIRYGGTRPADPGPALHVHSTFARPITGTAGFDIVRDETMRITATLASGALFVASVQPRLPHSTYEQSRPPFSNQLPHLSGSVPLWAGLSRVRLARVPRLLSASVALSLVRRRLPRVALLKALAPLEIARARLTHRIPSLLSVPPIIHVVRGHTRKVLKNSSTKESSHV